MTARVRTCLWFDCEGEEAASFYVSLLPGSRLENVYRRDAAGPPLLVDFSLAGAPYQALNGGPVFTHSEAASIAVLCADQRETDRLWNALVAGGSEGRCGWLKDRYGVSWQIVPEALPRMLGAPDRAAAARAMEAMMTMTRLDVARLEAAFVGKG
jgi:predicted 3-demethylubiquinone-9 3-methyltransferase (glyoxalase superfamily)